MCSVDEHEDVASCMPEKLANTLVVLSSTAEDGEIEVRISVGTGSICRKCNEKPAEVVLRLKDPYCRSCFLAATTHKYRASLGKSKQMKDDTHVLLAHSGSQSSLALLHLVWMGLQETTHKRHVFNISVIYIDEGIIFGHSVKQRSTTYAAVMDQVHNFHFSFYATTLSRVFCDNTENTCLLNPDLPLEEEDELDLKLLALFKNVTSLTSKEDLLLKLRNQLLVRVAKELKCSKVFVGESSTRLAVKILTNVALGRGAHLSLDVGFCDSRDGAIKVLRPMRDFTNKEVAFYNFFNKLEPVVISSLGTKADTQASIQKLTEKFVTDLQDNFPATVSTVFRTGEKLSGQSGISNGRCHLCQLANALVVLSSSVEDGMIEVRISAPLDTAHIESSALQATHFSRMVSALGPSGFDSGSIQPRLVTDSIGNILENETPAKLNKEPSTCGTCNCVASPKQVVSRSLIDELLCYGCRLITKDMVGGYMV
uniref:Cytoplasmic tRNA 2-thiolation protein 2 n=1 Tax=Timema genevievae TaxID=629358 RepID=A0A7R9K0E1_TIMGE|nr:unnamed protein product [Timema genevievae]